MGKEQAQFVITRIQGLLDEGRDPKEIAVLYRAHYQALDMQMELSRAGIPYQITSGVRFFSKPTLRTWSLTCGWYTTPATPQFHEARDLLPKIGEKADRSSSP